MLQKNDRTLNTILIKIQNCISLGNVSEYMAIADEITSSVNNPLTLRFNNFGFCLLQNEMNDYHTVTIILSDYFRSFAAKYPEQFSQFDFTGFLGVISSAAMIEIMKNSKTAYSLIDMIIPIIKCTPSESDYSKLLYTAAFSANDIMFEYIAAKIDNICREMSYDLVLYLFEEGKYSLLDMIFKNSDRDDIIGFGRGAYILPPYTQFRNYFRLSFRLFYEITSRYLADTSDKEKISDIASDFFDEIDLFSSVLKTFNISCFEYEDEWNFLTDHGIRIRNITTLLWLDYSWAEKKNVIQKFILPNLDDKVYIDVEFASYRPDTLRNITDLIGMIGADRIYLLIRCDQKLEDQSGFNHFFSLSWITKTDLEVRFDDNIIGTNMILNILNSSNVLKLFLKQNKLSDVQINELIDICIKQKDTRSLNIIRQFTKR